MRHVSKYIMGRVAPSQRSCPQSSTIVCVVVSVRDVTRTRTANLFSPMFQAHRGALNPQVALSRARLCDKLVVSFAHRMWQVGPVTLQGCEVHEGETAITVPSRRISF